MLPEQVVLVGAGNVAGHLGRVLRKNGVKVALVFSRQIGRASALAAALGCPATADLSAIPALDNCLYLIAVKDDAIETVATQLSFLSGPGRIFAHTSGTVSSEVLARRLHRSAVFYPLQSFSPGREPDFRRIPLCIYAEDSSVRDQLFALGRLISETVEEINDDQRKVLHLAAVFVNNFSNHLFAIGQKLVEQEALSFDLLRPLIAETAAKVMDHDPAEMQTGPAKRGDQHTMLAHLQYLQRRPDYQNLYRLLSHSIAEFHKS